MNTTIQKWGNSHGIRIPKIILEQLNFKENDKIEIIADNDSIILKKAVKYQHKTLEDRLETFYGKPLNMIENIEQSDELDWGIPAGEEIW